MTATEPVGSRKMRRIRHPRHDRDSAGGFTEDEANKASTA